MYNKKIKRKKEIELNEVTTLDFPISSFSFHIIIFVPMALAIKSKRIPILFFANKMDIRDALSDVGVSSALGLDSITNKSWHICSSNALTGDGVADGIEWLSSAIKTSLEQARR